MSNTTGPCKALIAFGIGGTPIILAMDNYWLAEEISNISDNAEEVGVEAHGNYPPGLYLFEGEGVWFFYRNSEGSGDAELEFNGTT